MPRRLGASVPQTVSRLLQGGLLSKPPAWFSAVGTVAPLRPSLTRKIPALPSLDPSPSTSNTSASTSADPYAWNGPQRLSKKKSAKLRPRPPKPAPLRGLELQDKVRRTFYSDHPFEAFRGASLVEFEGVTTDDMKPGPKGKLWTELRQRSMHPSPEDAVDFTLNLHKTHGIPLALAYSASINQFRSLRATHEIALASAQAELEAHGHTWPTEFSDIDRLRRAETDSVMQILKEDNTRIGGGAAASGGAANAAKKAAGSMLEPVSPSSGREWTGGAEYLLKGRRHEQQ